MNLLLSRNTIIKVNILFFYNNREIVVYVYFYLVECLYQILPEKGNAKQKQIHQFEFGGVLNFTDELVRMEKTYVYIIREFSSRITCNGVIYEELVGTSSPESNRETKGDYLRLFGKVSLLLCHV